MTTPRRIPKQPPIEFPNIPLPGGTDSGTKWLIAAVLAAGKDGCGCPSCQLLKKFGGALSDALLKESESSEII